MDTVSKKKRSENMSKIRSKNTQIELQVFRYLRLKSIYFQKHYNRAPGKPDIALPRKKIAVFIDGDFWHGRNFIKNGQRLPEYWKKKICENILRDKRNVCRLRRLGWKVMRVWESALNKNSVLQLKKIAECLISGNTH